MQVKSLINVPNKTLPCPFHISKGECNKKGGVCSILAYHRTDDAVTAEGAPVITCPRRFFEADLVHQWVGETLLGTSHPIVVNEVPFLMGVPDVEGSESQVGRIDSVLLSMEGQSRNWCALEMQAVYFSGGNMGTDFSRMTIQEEEGLVYPSKNRRPDFRSSGPKRLMPQLQIKVPTLRRWGKKMAVVIDRQFFASLGKMRETPHISNCDIVWFVVDLVGPKEGAYKLERHSAIATTLEHAVEGLTGGEPVSLETFETSIERKLARREANSGRRR